MMTGSGAGHADTLKDGDTWRETQWMRHVWWITIVVAIFKEQQLGIGILRIIAADEAEREK